MTYTLSQVETVLNQLWPQASAQSWDRPGRVCGGNNWLIKRVLLAVDGSLSVAEEAINTAADLLLLHHPPLFRPLTSLAYEEPVGALLTRLIQADCAVFAVHTNADAAQAGVADTLAKRLDLVDTQPLEDLGEGLGLGRVGNLPAATTLGRLALRLREFLPEVSSPLRATMPARHSIRRVALCPGAGDSLLDNEMVLGSDVYITADLRHHPALGFVEKSGLVGSRCALLEISHWAGEWLWLDEAARAIATELPGLKTVVSRERTDVWYFSL